MDGLVTKNIIKKMKLVVIFYMFKNYVYNFLYLGR